MGDLVIKSNASPPSGYAFLWHLNPNAKILTVKWLDLKKHLADNFQPKSFWNVFL